jgi:p-hydroxybenzoate 3-monooxygenase
VDGAVTALLGCIVDGRQLEVREAGVGDWVQETEVCVVGAGPAGLVLALMLEQAGIPCVVLECLSREKFERRAGAGLIEHRTVRLLDAQGLADPILLHGAINNVCEFRLEGQSLALDYSALTGGRGSYIYAQHELVAAYAHRLMATGGELHFGMRVTGVDQNEELAIVTAVAEETREPVRIECRFVAGCDGARSVLLPAIHDATVIELHHPFRWLTLIADAAPSKARTLYGCHRRGFAGQMRRGAKLTRFMLEVPRGDTVDDWPDDSIWAELQDRLHADGEPEIVRGELLERDTLDLRVRVAEPMHDRRVYLAGDAAHLITPAGGKGMNLAIQDALELGYALQDRYRPDPAFRRLTSYSTTRLPAIWRTQEFSNWMLTLLHAGVSQSRHDTGGRQTAEASEFAYQLRRARLHELINNEQLSRWFAHAYAGVDPNPAR